MTPTNIKSQTIKKPTKNSGQGIFACTRAAAKNLYIQHRQFH